MIRWTCWGPHWRWAIFSAKRQRRWSSAKVPHARGRVEAVPTPGKDYTILIDYAHTPDSMVNVLQTVK
ncbi:MAG: hypothetical protein ACLU38_09465 [Dysosmobacter sp.]